MKKYLFWLGIILAIYACENDNYHDTGLADGKHNCSMWDYFAKDHENWDSVVIMIERAGLITIFDGTHPQYKEITFFGITNLSVIEFLVNKLDENQEIVYKGVRDIPEEMCRRILLSHIVPKKIRMEEVDYEVKGTLTGGTIVKNLSGCDLRVYRARTSFMGVPDIGAEELKIHALESGQQASVGSSNIEVTNGVVHALAYTYQMTEL